MFEEITAWMAWMLASADYREESAVIEELGARATMRAQDLTRLYEHVGMGGITEAVEGLREAGRLTDANVVRMRDLWQEVEHDQEALLAVSLSSPRPGLEANLTTLHIFGVITLTLKGDVAFFFIRTFRPPT